MSRPRLGFLGVGWIGRHRMGAMLATGAVEAAAVADLAPELVADALAAAPGAVAVADLDAMLAMGLDGVVIATPSALHAAQAEAALAAGVPVFCQKPLGRDAAEAAAVVAAARAADRLLGVDFSYRETAGMRAVKALVDAGELGRVFAVDLRFHNAWGPGKPWFFDRALSGGGCVIDLGVHLVDLALWVLGFPALDGPVAVRLFAKGTPLAAPLGPDAPVEDYAEAQFGLAGGAVVRLACSWHANAGREAVIAADFYGDRGGASFRNVGGSFFDFAAHRHRGTASELLADGPDDWGGRAAAGWALALAASPRFDPAAERLVEVARVLDCLYAGA